MNRVQLVNSIAVGAYAVLCPAVCYWQITQVSDEVQNLQLKLNIHEIKKIQMNDLLEDHVKTIKDLQKTVDTCLQDNSGKKKDIIDDLISVAIVTTILYCTSTVMLSIIRR